jgi:hypothetical protein
MSNDAMMKAMAVHCKCMSKAHEAASSAHQSLSECFKAEQAEGLHKGMKDMHADLQSCHKSMAESYGKLGDACKKSAGTDEAELTKAIVGAVIAHVDEKFGNLVQPTSVKAVVPSVPDVGLQMIGRNGGMATPTDPSRLDPQLRELVAE